MKRLAYLKANNVAQEYKDALVIGCDTLTYFNGLTIGKPKDKDDQMRTLLNFSGRVHKVFTGVCVINTETRDTLLDYAESDVKFKKISEKDIEGCSERDKGLDGVGAYTPEMHEDLFESVAGSYSNVVGLPTEVLVPMLEKNGIRLGKVRHMVMGDY